MGQIFTEKPFSKKWFISYTYIVVGAMILALGFVLFINPYNIVPGGVYGISIVVHYLTKGLFSFWPDGIPIGFFGLILNIPLTILGIKILGPRFGVKTVIGLFLTSAFMDLLTMVIGENDPLGLKDDLLLACLFGGVVIGVGLALIFKSKATSGGSDIIAMILAKYTKMQVGQLLIYVDSFIVLFGLAVLHDWKIPLYSWLVIFITGKVIDSVMEGASGEKMFLIISEKHEEIRNKIIIDLERGGTYLYGEGMYQGASKKVIFTVINRREVSILEEYINEIDPDAFVAIIDAKEILGYGFKSLPEKIIQSK
jgi:uncharacterized membrane-anchored protein YitT (DUF2179 family)